MHYKTFPIRSLLFAATVSFFVSCGFLYGPGTEFHLRSSPSGILTPTGSSPYRYGGLVDAGAPGSAEQKSETVEPDVFHLDAEGKRLYAANAYRGLVAFDISDPAHPALAGRVPVTGVPKELYFYGTKIILLVDPTTSYGYGYRYGYGYGYAGPVAGPAGKSAVVVLAADALAAGSGAGMTRIELGGTILDSRMIGSTLVVATDEGYVASVEVSPLSRAAGNRKLVGSDVVAGTNLARIWSVDPIGGTADSIAVSGSVTAIHVAQSSVFAAIQNTYSAGSTIVRYDFNPSGILAESGRVSIPGSVADRFKMDFFGGWLRVVAFDPGTGWSGRLSRAFAIDWRDPATPHSFADEPAGCLELAEGETLHAVRYDGDRCYVVTYLTRDPLFVLSFADPPRPTQLGKLEVPGYSVHIEPVIGPSGENWLFAVGVDDSGRTKVSLFDVGDGAHPTESGSILLGEAWSWSSAIGDWKRINRLPALGAFAVPYYEWKGGVGGFSVALVKYDSTGPRLLCNLPDSGDCQRTIPAGPDLVYTYAPDRLLSWRIAGMVPTLCKAVQIAEDVRWASAVGTAGVKLVQTDAGISLRTFHPGDFSDSSFVDKLDIPQSGADGSWSYWPGVQGTIGWIPGCDSIWLVREEWSRSGEGRAVLDKVNIASDLSLTFGAAGIHLPWSSAWIPGLYAAPEPSVISADHAHLVVYHGIVSIVDVPSWTAIAKIPTQGSEGIGAFASGTAISLFEWKVATGESGYGQIRVSRWDITDPAAPRHAFSSDFPGYPLAPAGGDNFISAYPKDDEGRNTVLVAVRANASGSKVLDERDMEGTVLASAGFGDAAVLLAGSPVWPMAMGAAKTVSSRSSIRTASRASTRASSNLALRSAYLRAVAGDRAGEYVFVVDEADTLEGYQGGIAVSGDRLAAGTDSGITLCGPPSSGGGIAVLGRFASAGVAPWTVPGMSFGGAYLYASRSFAGIERYATR